jgi:hypothetical protein
VPEVNGCGGVNEWKTSRRQRSAAETVSVMIDSPDAEQLSPVMGGDLRIDSP